MSHINIDHLKTIYDDNNDVDDDNDVDNDTCLTKI